ncbi:sodium-dependent transporter [Paenibacillus taiwanensis]|uniref:sodium-dependent transporter n=1 Tax=Paenibacillus taiwanensis TaxID=401638 RepID=UPI000421D62D|nr:sodium-dependent transporter [Paenibacillus taiwanensis]
MNRQAEKWTSKVGFIMAAAGSAIGIGAIWKLPYIAGTNGGGAFFLLFILFTLLIGLPLLLAEFVIGRSTQKTAVEAYEALAPKSGWKWIGRLGVFTSFMILCFYSVVGGWTLVYLFRSLMGQLVGAGVDYSKLFDQTIANPTASLIGQCSFILITILVVAKGVQKGIETVSKFLLPGLFLLFVVLIIRSLTLQDAMKGVEFFLRPDFSKLTSEGILFALGQSFFAISVGISIMVTYSSYLDRKESLPRSAFTVVGLNLLVSLLAGLAIFPAIFSAGLEPTAGPGLLFIALPSVFEHIPFGGLFLTAFLALFAFATLTSSFSLLENIVASFPMSEGHAQRKRWSWMIGGASFALGVPAALSFGVLDHVTIAGKNIFDFMDFTACNVLMPIGALLISLFVAHRLERSVLIDQLHNGSSSGSRWFTLWIFLLKYVVPVAIIIVFLNAIGIVG